MKETDSYWMWLDVARTFLGQNCFSALNIFSLNFFSVCLPGPDLYNYLQTTRPSAVNGETAWMLVVNFWISPVIEIFFNHLATSITFLYSSLLQGVSLFYMIIN